MSIILRKFKYFSFCVDFKLWGDYEEESLISIENILIVD